MSAENLKRSFFYQALKATAIAVLLCVFSAALFAVLARFVTLSATAVKISGIAAKIFSLFIAALVSFRRRGKRRGDGRFIRIAVRRRCRYDLRHVCECGEAMIVAMI